MLLVEFFIKIFIFACLKLVSINSWKKGIENSEIIWQRTIMHKLCHNTFSKGKGKTHNFKSFALCKSIDTTKCVRYSKVIQILCTAGSKGIRRVSNVKVRHIGIYSKDSRIYIGNYLFLSIDAPSK